jgi:hypothetical protein
VGRDGSSDVFSCDLGLDCVVGVVGGLWSG